MPHPPAFQLKQKQTARLQQMQRLIMAPKIQQSLAFLQMARMEMEAALQQELEENPLLEMQEEEEEGEGSSEREEENEKSGEAEKELDFTEQDFLVLRQLDEDFRDHFGQSENFYTQRTADEEQLKNFAENSILAHVSLSEHLLRQSTEAFSSEKELKIAETLIGYLDRNGFLSTPLEEIAQWHSYPIEEIKNVLCTIQTFEPSGVGAQSLVDSLLLQLRQKKKEGSLAYKIIEEHFDDLLHNRIPKIVQGLHLSSSEITAAVEGEISKLNLHPGLSFSETTTQLIYPDITIKADDVTAELQVFIHDECCFSLRLNSRYLRLLDDPQIGDDTHDFIKKKMMSAKWLMRNLYQRSQTLEKITRHLIQTHYLFFSTQEGAVAPLSMQQVADELGMHESTIARAVSNKYIACPKGVYPLRFFFSTAYTTSAGEDVSSRAIKEQLQLFISSEDKSLPYTDAQLSDLLKEKGISCARRTIAKYRGELELGNAQKRRRFK